MRRLPVGVTLFLIVTLVVPLGFVPPAAAVATPAPQKKLETGCLWGGGGVTVHRLVSDG